LDAQFGAVARRPRGVSAVQDRSIGRQLPVPSTSATYCPPALDDDDDDVSTTWVASHLPELSDPMALEFSTLCVAVSTAEASVQTERAPSVRSVGVDARPVPSPVVGRDASVQAHTESLSVGTDARALPAPWLSPPDIPTQGLASAMADIIAARPDAPSDVISQELRDRFPGSSLPQRRTFQLATDFGVDLGAQMAQRLLYRMVHHFGHLSHIEPSAIVAFLADQLNEWTKRPTLIRHSEAMNLHH